MIALLVFTLVTSAYSSFESTTELGQFKPSYYNISDESQYPQGNTLLRDKKGNTLGKVSPQFRKALIMEGTGILRNGVTVNVSSIVNKEYRFVVSPSPFGLGASGCPLVPFRSVAVDRKVIKLGTALYIPKAVGMALPDGSKHDGVFWADDTGGMIKGARLDMFGFLGEQSWAPYQKVGIIHMKPMTVYRLDDVPRKVCSGQYEVESPELAIDHMGLFGFLVKTLYQNLRP